MSLSKIFPIQNNLEDGKTIITTNPSTTVDWWLRDAGGKGSFATHHINPHINTVVGTRILY